ncbi:MAG: ABC transporter ATP-binding protein [Sphaerochaetaceae bacterium]|nr:ABC transporter ATP-binding protein [Spirochaetales bacterium]MDY5498525.1 ABC transporter ATP-binding protein [Sphaerochaetaceae bacterium]
MADILCIEHLNGGYDTPIFQDFSLRIPQGGRLVTLLGPNGSGKSTLLKFLYRQLPYRGNIWVDGINLSSLRQRELARHLCLVPQNGRIDYDFTVGEAVRMASFSPDDTRTALQLCHLEGKEQTSVQELSGGEFQRTLIARALAQASPLMLLDEPVSSLDIAQQIGMMRLFKRLAHEGKTLVCVLHDLLLAQVYSDEVVLIQKGKLVSQGKPEVVLTPEHLSQVYGVETQELADSSGRLRLLCPRW